MTDINGRPNNIEDALGVIHSGQWFGWSDVNNKVYSNLIISEKVGIDGSIVDNPITELPSEEEVNDKLIEIQTDFDDAKTKQETDKASGNQKLKDLGLTDDEITAITKG
tara:strand:- start:41 stop:367 length:327 start_codon:yes stop_codon:yes gene_type:complete